jgi:photosynthetic reaction center cytochrome c subunit
MRRLWIFTSSMGMVFALLFAVATVASAQQERGSMNGKTAEEVYKNIQVLKGTPATDLNQTMHLIAGSLGVGCNFCHIEDRASDEKPAKETARKMMRMVMAMNKEFFNGRQEVSCYTCHRGSFEPVNVPIVPVPPAQAREPRPTNLPTADQILSKYVEALGGEQALRKVTSREVIATEGVPTGPGGSVVVPGQLERYMKAPNLRVDVVKTDKFTISSGFDGTKAWSQNERGRVSELPSPDQERAKRNADFYQSLDLMQEYTKLRVVGIRKVNDHDAYEVLGTVQGDSPERLFFDTQTGLLLRKSTYLATAIGRSPLDVDYDDYRDTGSGTKYPFLIRYSPASLREVLTSQTTIHVQSVKDNLPIDDAKFAMPQSKAPSARGRRRNGSS